MFLLALSLLAAGCRPARSAQNPAASEPGPLSISAAAPSPTATGDSFSAAGDPFSIAIAAIRTLTDNPGLQLDYLETSASPNANLRRALVFLDPQGNRYWVDEQTLQVIEFTLEFPATGGGGQAKSLNELRAIAADLARRRSTRFAQLGERLAYEEGQKGERYFFRWEDRDAHWQYMPPLLQIGLDAGGRLVSYLNTLDLEVESPSASSPGPGNPAEQAADCRRIAFAAVDDRHSRAADLYALCPDGSGLIRLTDHPAADDSPAWSPDGGRIAFVSSRSGSRQVYWMYADGNGLAQVSFDYENSLPRWLPDGERLAFRSTDGDGLWWWRAVNSDGSETALLSEPSYDFFFQTPSWSPDGTKIAYMSLEEQRPRNDGSSQIHVKNVDGSQDLALTDDIWANLNPLWSPDGRQIAFLSERDGAYNQFALYVMGADGAHVRRLTPARFDESGAIYSWSPDGLQIALGDANAGKIYLLDLLTGRMRELIVPLQDVLVYSPAWQP